MPLNSVPVPKAEGAGNDTRRPGYDKPGRTPDSGRGGSGGKK